MNSEVPGGKHQRIVKMIIALHKHLNIPTDAARNGHPTSLSVQNSDP